MARDPYQCQACKVYMSKDLAERELEERNGMMYCVDLEKCIHMIGFRKSLTQLVKEGKRTLRFRL